MATFVKTRDIPIAGAHTLPQEFFTSPELFAQEFDRIFARRWICIGRESKIAKNGDYFLHTIGKESIIVLRDQSGEVRAHYNTCRHRGARMCEAASGTFSETIQCPYHAWTYALDGRLVGAQTSDSIPGFDKKNFPLVSVAIAAWEGFLFINLDPNPEPFVEAFASLLGRFERFNLPGLTVARTIEYDVKANWKLVFQNYSECYHCSPVHPQLVKITPSNSGENDLFEGPFLGGFMVMNEQHESLSMSGQACGVPVGELDEADMRRVYYYSIFPNMLLSLHPDYVMAHYITPVAPDRSLITCEWLFHPDSVRDGTWNVEDGIAFWDLTNRQDWHVCEISQAGIGSRGYRPGPYSSRESLSVMFDREVLNALGRDGEGGGDLD
jgi:Rieske 2Fe-2S family protein